MKHVCSYLKLRLCKNPAPVKILAYPSTGCMLQTQNYKLLDTIVTPRTRSLDIRGHIKNTILT